jgi:hypothetical protein
MSALLLLRNILLLVVPGAFVAPTVATVVASMRTTSFSVAVSCSTIFHGNISAIALAAGRSSSDRSRRRH